MVKCDHSDLVAPNHPKAMITILEPSDIDTWLSGTNSEVVGLQAPYVAQKITVRGPVLPTRRNER